MGLMWRGGTEQQPSSYIYVIWRALIQNEAEIQHFLSDICQDCLFRIKLFHWKFECFVPYMSSLLFSQQNHVFQASHLSVCLDPWRRRGWSESGAHVLGERGELRVTSRPLSCPCTICSTTYLPWRSSSQSAAACRPNPTGDSLMSAQQRMVSPTASVS